jgi:hypothetical protein
MSRIRFTAVLALGLLGACAEGAAPRVVAPPDLPVPAALRQTNTEPGRAAIGFTDSVFDRTARLQGRPATIADAVSELEWLTVTLPTDQRWIGLPGNVAGSFPAARDEVRQAFGLRADATPAQVIGAMDGAAAALRANDRDAALRALGAVTPAGGAERTLAALAAPPALPRASQATSMAAAGLSQMDRDSRR